MSSEQLGSQLGRGWNSTETNKVIEDEKDNFGVDGDGFRGAGRGDHAAAKD